MSSLVAFAQQILHGATALQRLLDDASASSPTLEAGGPAQYIPPENHPAIYETRATLVDAINDMLTLTLGPMDRLRALVNNTKADLAVLRVVEKYDIAKYVPYPGSVSIASLSTELKVNGPILERIIRHAFTMRLFQEPPDLPGHIEHTALSLALPTLSPWIRLQLDKITIQPMMSLPETVSVWSDPPQPGERQLPFQLANDDNRPPFEMIKAEFGMKQFSDAMRSHILAMPGSPYSFILRGFDFKSVGAGPLVDLGGGNGHVGIAVAEANPQLKVIIQDLSENEKPANDLIPADMRNRVRFQSQDFFTPQPANLETKAFLLRSILHDWNDEDCVKILTHLLPTLSKGARLFIVDRILPDASARASKEHDEDSMVLSSRYEEAVLRHMDLMMFALLGTKERSLRQWRELFSKVGDGRLKVQKWSVPPGCEFGMLTVVFD